MLGAVLSALFSDHLVLCPALTEDVRSVFVEDTDGRAGAESSNKLEVQMSHKKGA